MASLTMAYQTNSALPSHVRSALPEAAQTRFRMIANDVLAKNGTEATAIRKAWSAVTEGWKKPAKGDVWIRKLASDLEKAKPRTLYVSRKVKNGKDIVAWAKSQGFQTTTEPDDLHVTICYSKRPVDWMKVPSRFPSGLNGKDDLVVAEGGARLVEPLGDKGAVVLLFNNDELRWRHESLLKAGASSDFDGYQPHVTITWDKGDTDLSQVEPYTGKIVFGPEIFKEIDDNWQSKHVEKADYEALVVKFDENQPRDENGRFSGGGGSAAGDAPEPKAATATPKQRGLINRGFRALGRAGWAATKILGSIVATVVAKDVLLLAGGLAGGALGLAMGSASLRRQARLGDNRNPLQIGKAEFDLNDLTEEQAQKIIDELPKHLSEEDAEKVLIALEKEQTLIDKMDVTILKVDKSLGLVFGWAIICKNKGEDYYDLNIDKSSGERVPEHITEAAMLEAAMDFMNSSRVAKEMHSGEEKGNVPFAFPLTTEIAKAMGLSGETTGLMIAMKPSKDVLAKFLDGRLTGFSIGGSRIKVEDLETS